VRSLLWVAINNPLQRQAVRCSAFEHCHMASNNLNAACQARRRHRRIVLGQGRSHDNRTTIGLLTASSDSKSKPKLIRCDPEIRLCTLARSYEMLLASNNHSVHVGGRSSDADVRSLRPFFSPGQPFCGLPHRFSSQFQAQASWLSSTSYADHYRSCL
jgi:hypothetical protein